MSDTESYTNEDTGWKPQSSDAGSKTKQVLSGTSKSPDTRAVNTHAEGKGWRSLATILIVFFLAFLLYGLYQDSGMSSGELFVLLFACGGLILLLVRLRKSSGPSKLLLVLSTIMLAPLVALLLFNGFAMLTNPENDQVWGLVLLTLAGGLAYLLIRFWRGSSATKETLRTNRPKVLLRGIVRGMTQGSETTASGKQRLAWNFRIECFEEGRLVNTIPVKMSGEQFFGAINDGDEVQVYHWKKGTLLQTGRVRNWTSGIEVRAINHSFQRVVIGLIVFVIFIVLVIGMMTSRPR